MQLANAILLSIDLLVPNPNQPRKLFKEETLNELANSIKEYGILNPVLVRKKQNLYEIIAGERRYRAAKIAGLTEIPVIIKDMDDSKISEIALIENLQRENITPIEEAKTYEEILNNNNITEEKLSELLGKSQPWISNKLRLLKLPKEIQEALNNKQISEKHARSLLTIDNYTEQIELLEKIINEKLTVKELDNIIIEKKEEKESDNMNNGNFFPNYNNQDQSNNISLNQMNMQTMNMPTPGQSQQITPPMDGQIVTEPSVIQPIIPTEPVINQENTQMAQLPQVEIQNMEVPTTEAEANMPELNNQILSPIPEFGINNTMTLAPMIGENAQNMTLENINQTADIPLFSELNSSQTPVETPLSQTTPIIEPPITSFPEQNVTPETPLFNQELNNNVEPNINESFYEVPVNVSPVIEESKENKLTQVEQLLSNNNIEYKAYSNEKGHCIIIEL